MGIAELADPSWWTVQRGGLAVATTTAVIALGSMQLNRFNIRESYRPIMIARLEHGGKARSPLDLVIANVGRSPAHQVKVTFDPDLPTAEKSHDGQSSVIPLLRKRYRQVFPVWTPGVERRNTYWIIDVLPNQDGEVDSVDGVPREVVAVIRYKLSSRRLARSITERYPLRISEMENETFRTATTDTSTHQRD